MIVADASVVVDAVMFPGVARQTLRDQDVHVPHLLDSEFISALRRHVAAGLLDSSQAPIAIAAYRGLGIRRHAIHGFADRIWELRDNVTPYDAAYVALAEAVDCPLVTSDARLARAPGLRCVVSVLNG